MDMPKLNCFLQTRAEIDNCTQFLKVNNLVEHALGCKNWDLAKIVPYLGNGNILDMGCIGSHILDNVARLNLTGLRYGVDLMFKPEDIDDSAGSWNNASTPKVPGCKFFQSDLMKTPFDNDTFQCITCLSVIEHGVDFDLLASECSRLLSHGGKLFITYDYWDPKVDTKEMKLYDLRWNILDKNAVLSLVNACSKNGLHLSEPIDWATQDQVINPNYNSPSNVSYTFGILLFTKI